MKNKNNTLDIKAILFDKDGTLFDFNQTWGCWFNNILTVLSKGNINIKEKLSYSVKYDLLNKVFLKDSPIIAETIDQSIPNLLKHLPDWTFGNLSEWLNKEVELVQGIPVDNLKNTLITLKSMEYKLGVATNDNEKCAFNQLKNSEVLKFFDFIAGCDSGFGSKPETGMHKEFCIVTGLKPYQIVMVGDSLMDLKSGNDIGMYTVGVLTGPAIKSDLDQEADIILNSIEELPQHINKIIN